MKKLIFVSLFFVSFTSLSGQILSPSAEISLLSCERGYELYNSYGHSALRIKDQVNGIDYVYNYGTFDDSAPNFLGNFIRGTVDYTLSRGNFNRFMYSYDYENRSVIEQVLNLDSTEKQSVFNRVRINHETDEKYYKYDFFFDNCSSRIHEILKEVLGENLQYGSDLNENSPDTFRELIDPYMKHSPWAEFGVGIIMGYPTDRTATNKEKMFLPDHMMERFDLATHKGNPFVKRKHVLFQSTPTVIQNSFLKDPVFIFILLALLVSVISFVNYRKDKHYYWIDYLLLFIIGIAGIFFLFMWFGTRHSPTFQNMNMFWAMPLNLLVLFFLKKKIIKPYLLIMMILNLVGFFILPQVFHWAILPISIMMAIRYLKLYTKL